MDKKIKVKPTSDIRSAGKQASNHWRAEKSTTALAFHRLSIDIPEYMHRRIKETCAAEGVSMKEKINEAFLKIFPEK